jgi:hypothetical protein
MTMPELSNDQLYAIGYGDGLADRLPDSKFTYSLDYAMGHTMGRRTRAGEGAGVLASV